MLEELFYSIWYYSALSVGLFTALVWCYRACCVFLRSFGFGTKMTLERYGRGSWAIVTGATDGIGKASAIHLANEGFNVVLMSRTQSKLESVAKEVEESARVHGKEIKTRVI